MVTDLFCWLIFASGIALLAGGCVFTKPQRQPELASTVEPFEQAFDRAA